MTKGPLFIVSGASGSGKTTVIDRLLAEMPPGRVRLSVSATTRQPRAGEIDGKHYYFWSRERFEEGIDRQEFLEHAEVHGHYYGTLRGEVEPYCGRGMGVILDIDVQGAAQIRRLYPDAVTIFLRTSSTAAYEKRLRERGTETEGAIRRRLATAARELDHAGEYDHQVVNDDLDSAVAQLGDIVKRHLERGNHAG
jgi:guanylate kinase